MSADPVVRRQNFTAMAMVAAAVVLTAAPAVVHGVWSRRWQDPADITAAARSVEAFPRQFGDWKQHGDEAQLPEEAIRELQCAGYINRHYVNQKLGRNVTILLMVGPSGPLVRHPPEICYGNQANKLLQDPVDVNVATPDAQKHTFRFLRYKDPGAASGEFCVCYGWSANGTWDVPDYPRVRYGSEPLLYKLQVLTSDSVPHDGGLPVATSQFLNEFLPLMRDRLQPGRAAGVSRSN
jgi:Protein of unknown function (DUF3485)